MSEKNVDVATSYRARDLRRAHWRDHGRKERRDGGPASFGERIAEAAITAAFAALAFALRTLPREEAVELGGTLGGLASFFMRKRRRVALENLAIAFPELDPSARARIAFRAFANAGRTIVEIIRFPSMSRREVERTVEIVGREHYEKVIYTPPGGFLGLSAHSGNFELLAVGTSALYGHKNAIVGRRIKPPAVDAIVRGLRASHGVDTTSNKEVVRELLGRLHAGQGIGVVLDQNMKSGTGVFVPFFGRLASTTPGLSILARRSGAPVLPSFATRVGELGRHRIVFLPPIAPVEVEGRGAILADTARYTKVIEDWVRAHPDDWFWFHQRWRTRPPDELARAGAAPPSERDGDDDDEE